MKNFAQITPDGKVIRVLVVEQEIIDTGALGDVSSWIETGRETVGGIHRDLATNLPSEDQSKALRKNYAGAGYTYDAARDAFIPPKPAAVDAGDFVLDEQTCLWKFVPRIAPQA